MDSNRGFENIASNADIMTHIYKLLNFNDQLRLAHVNAELRFVFKEFIVKDQYHSTVNIYTYRDGYTIADESNSNRKILTRREFQDFKLVCADDVHELKFEAEITTNIMPRKIVDIECISETLFCGKPFINLQSLQCSVPELRSIIPLVAKNLPYLKSLHLNELVRKDEREVENETMKCLLQMKNLQRLCLNYCEKALLKYQHFCQLIHELKLEVLEGTLFVINDNYKIAKNVLLTKEVPLRELRILATFNQRNSISHNPTFFKIFENLTKVHLEVNKGLNEEMWSLLTKSCKNLNILTIKDTSFENITIFSIPSTVTKLHLLECCGLTHKNLRQILTETNITELVSHYTNYSLMEEFEDVSISPLIENLNVDALDLCKFTSIYKQNENLKHLSWHLCAPESSCHLESCINLETLEMPYSSQMCNDTVLQLKHLRKLTTAINVDHMWSDICALLRHPPLRELNIRCSTYADENEAPIEGFPTKVTTLNVEYMDRAYAFDFFLDLFCQNLNMQLSFLFCFHPPEKYIRLLITSKYFPTDLKEIQIRGFRINCSDLRNNFDETMKDIIRAPWGELNLNHIILRRK